MAFVPSSKSTSIKQNQATVLLQNTRDLSPGCLCSINPHSLKCQLVVNTTNYTITQPIN